MIALSTTFCIALAVTCGFSMWHQWRVYQSVINGLLNTQHDLLDRLYVSKGHAPVGEPAKQTKSAENGKQGDKVVAMPKGVAPLDKAFIDALEREREEMER